MTTFSPPKAPDYTSSRGTQPRALIAAFGDGYEQRAADGINAQLPEWSVRWSALTSSQLSSIESDFESYGAVTAFDWTIDGTSYQFRLISWRRIYVGPSIYDLEAQLKEVADI